VLNLLPLLWTALLLVAVALLVLVLRKVRLVHEASYKLLDDAAHTRTETGALFAQLQALMALEKQLDLAQALPPMRGWAGSPDFLLALAQQVTQRRPLSVMECSSGVSTVVIARCLQQLGQGHVHSLEHEPEYAEKTRALLQRHGLSDWATVLVAPLETVHTPTPWYAENALPATLKPVELLVVDGPPTSVARLARYPAYPRLRARLAEQHAVLVDDAARPDETEMVQRWRAENPRLAATDLYCEKGCTLLEQR
jgi:hypothetical protein